MQLQFILLKTQTISVAKHSGPRDMDRLQLTIWHLDPSLVQLYYLAY